MLETFHENDIFENMMLFICLCSLQTFYCLFRFPLVVKVLYQQVSLFHE